MADLRGYTLSFRPYSGVSMVTETCHSCGVLFAMTADHKDRRLKDGKDFWCPNGHSQYYIQGKTDAQKLKEAEAQLVHQGDQLRAAIRDAETARVQVLRDRLRFASGMCPCCGRFFKAVMRHMASQHPEYDAKLLRGNGKYKCGCGSTFKSFHGLRTHQGQMRGENWSEPDVNRWVSHLTVLPS